LAAEQLGKARPEHGKELLKGNQKSQGGRCMHPGRVSIRVKEAA